MSTTPRLRCFELLVFFLPFFGGGERAGVKKKMEASGPYHYLPPPEFLSSFSSVLIAFLPLPRLSL